MTLQKVKNIKIRWKVFPLWVIAFLLIFLALTPLSCRGDKPALGDKTAEAQAGYSMLTDNADIFVSDSGITQYHIKAKVWYIYEQEDRPHWYFPKGFFVEQVDSTLRQKAYLQSDTAYYFTDKEQWLFIGNVKVQNRSNDVFMGKRMLWEKETRMVSSDDTVTVSSGDRTLRGTAFKANQDFTRYTFYNNNAIVDIPEENQNTEYNSNRERNIIEEK